MESAEQAVFILGGPAPGSSPWESLTVQENWTGGFRGQLGVCVRVFGGSYNTRAWQRTATAHSVVKGPRGRRATCRLGASLAGLPQGLGMSVSTGTLAPLP